MVEKRMERFLHSVFKQKYENYHLVITDDNSNDNTVEFIREYLSNHDKLKSKTTIII